METKAPITPRQENLLVLTPFPLLVTGYWFGLIDPTVASFINGAFLFFIGLSIFTLGSVVSG